MIRHFRKRAGMSTRELARRTGVAASYVSKVELGQLGPQPAFCEHAARVLGLPRVERDHFGALLALYQVEHHPVLYGGDALRQAQQAVRQIERACRSFKSFQLSLIPGLLQTRLYAHAVFSRLTSRSHRTTSVRERLYRQKILNDPGRTFQFLLSDWALGPHWCSDRVMAGQLRHLRKLSRHPNIDIRILPPDFRFPNDVTPLVTGFEVLDQAVVIVDTLNGFTTFRQMEEVAAYVEVFNKAFLHAEQLTDYSSKSRLSLIRAGSG